MLWLGLSIWMRMLAKAEALAAQARLATRKAMARSLRRLILPISLKVARNGRESDGWPIGRNAALHGNLTP